MHRGYFRQWTTWSLSFNDYRLQSIQMLKEMEWMNWHITKTSILKMMSIHPAWSFFVVAIAFSSIVRRHAEIRWEKQLKIRFWSGFWSTAVFIFGFSKSFRRSDRNFVQTCFPPTWCKCFLITEWKICHRAMDADIPRWHTISGEDLSYAHIIISISIAENDNMFGIRKFVLAFCLTTLQLPYLSGYV